MTARAALSFDEVQRIAEAAGARYPRLVAAQYQLESSGGKHLSGANNPFGIKDPGGTVKTTQEVVNGKTITTQAGFKNFGSTEEAVQHLVDRWYKDYKGYKGVNNAPDLASAARMLKAQGYATDPNYASKLIKIAGGGDSAAAPAAQSSAQAGTGALPAVAPMVAGSSAATPAPAEAAAAAGGIEASLLEAAGLTGLSDPAGARLAAALTADLTGGGKTAGTDAVDDGLSLVTTLATGEQGQAAAAGKRMAGNKIGIVELGKRLQQLGFKVAENEAFGRVGGHSEGSLHYRKNRHGVGSALDLTIQPGSPLLKGLPDSDWRRVKKEWGAKLAAALPDAQVLHPGNEPKGHSSHIHLGIEGGDFPVTPQLAALLQLQQS